MAGAVVGKGFKFGYKQAGDAELLQILGKRAGLKIHISDLVGAAMPGVVGTVSFILPDANNFQRHSYHPSEIVCHLES